jgi:hypothetical protein
MNTFDWGMIGAALMAFIVAIWAARKGHDWIGGFTQVSDPTSLMNPR